MRKLCFKARNSLINRENSLPYRGTIIVAPGGIAIVNKAIHRADYTRQRPISALTDFVTSPAHSLLKDLSVDDENSGVIPLCLSRAVTPRYVS